MVVLDAVTIHEFLAQKAACSLESVDASYPSKVVGQEQELSPSVERQSYSEKRKFWEDISRKRESYQRSESEVSRTSQLTTNESDSEYVQNVMSTEDTADIIQQMGKSETLEDLNVPDISECSVAEKAQYFEEQIQKETTKPLPAKSHQQDSLKSANEREKPTKTKTSDEKEKTDKDEKYVAELKQVKKTEEKIVAFPEAEERRVTETKETKKKLSSEDEKEKDESKQICAERVQLAKPEHVEKVTMEPSIEEGRTRESVGEVRKKAEEQPTPESKKKGKEEDAKERIAGEERTRESVEQKKQREFIEKTEVKKAKEESRKDAMERVAAQQERAGDIEGKERGLGKPEGSERLEVAEVRRKEDVAEEKKAEGAVADDAIAGKRVETPEKSSGKRIITEETTIIYKVQKDGTLIQEKVLKSVQVEGGSEASSGLIEIPESRIIVDVKEAEIAVGKETLGKLAKEDREAKDRKDEEEEEKRKKLATETETKTVKKEFESRIPVSMGKIQDKDKIQRETKAKQLESETKGSEQEISPTTRKREFESRIPKRVVEVKPPVTSDKSGKKDTHGKKESESYTITEKKLSEQVTSKLEEHSTIETSETQTFSKSFADPKEAFKMFEEMESAKGRGKKEFATVTSKIDHKTCTMLEEKEVVSSEVSNGTEKVVTLEEKERVERKKSSESQLKKESPTETLEEKKSKREELDKRAVQRLSMNLTETEKVIDAAASESRAETKKEERRERLSDKEGVTTREAGSSVSRESDAEVAIRITRDAAGGKRDDEKEDEEVKTVERKEGRPAAERISRPSTSVDSDRVETLAQAESRRETRESFDVVQFVPSEKKREEEEEAARKKETKEKKEREEESSTEESLEEKQRQKFKEIEARTIAETLIQSIESEIEEKSVADLKAELLGKGYLEQIISESVETDHEKLADDLTRKFESIMRRATTSDKQQGVKTGDESFAESLRLRSSIQEELSLEKSSTRDSISGSEDITKDEESSPREKESSFPLSSSQAKLQDRDITMSPSSISEQIDFEETIDVDTNDLTESVSKCPTLSPQFEKQRFGKSNGMEMELQRDLQSTIDASYPRDDKMMSEISGARVLEVLEPGVENSQSREDSVDMPSLEMDEQKISDAQTSRGISSLHESAELDSLERLAQERDITISPSTVSEDINVDYSLVQESLAHHQPAAAGMQREHQLGPICTKRADSFEIESPPLVSPKPKVRGLEIKPVDWMIGDEKIEISETLQPSQIFNQELEAYESMRQQYGLPSLEGSRSTDHTEQESGTKSSEDVSVIESTKETVTFSREEDDRGGKDAEAQPAVSAKTKFTVIPVSEQDFESELVENKLDVSCQELVDTLQREYDAKTPIKEYAEEPTMAESEEREKAALEAAKPDSQILPRDETAKEEEDASLRVNGKTCKAKEKASSKAEMIELKLEGRGTMVSLKVSEKPAAEQASREEEVTATEVEKPVRVDDVLKEWTEAYLSKMKPLGDDYKRHMEKGTEKHDKPARSTTVPSDTCAFKMKKDDLPSVDLSARYAITVLDQVVKKEIAEVKESLEAAKQDLIEELSENSETVIQIKDSPSEFRFKLQPESIPNDLPFLYTPSFPEQTHESTTITTTDTEARATKSESPLPIDSSYEMPYETKDSSEDKAEMEESAFSSIEEPMLHPTRGDTPVIKTEKSDDVETATAITVHEDTKDDEQEEHPSPVPASRSGSDIDNKDESSSLALPRPVLRRRQKVAGRSRSGKRVTSDSDADLGSSSGESSNYQSCDYEIGSGSRPSSSDVEAMQSCGGVPSATASEYETAMMSMEHSSSSKPTSLEYHTAATTMSSRESMKSLTSLSSGHLGSIDSTSELSETLVPSETDAEKQEAEQQLDDVLDVEEHTEQSDSSGSDMPIDDEQIDDIYSDIPCRMKRSSEMIFPQVLDEAGAPVAAPAAATASATTATAAIEVERAEESAKGDAKGIDFATSTFATTPGTLQSVDIMTSRVSEDGVQSVCTQVISTQATSEAESKVDSVERVEGETFNAEDEVFARTEESELLEEQKYAAGGGSSESPEMSVQTSTGSMMQQASMSTSSISGVSIDTVVGKERSDRHSPDSDSFEMVDKPDIIDDFVVIEEVGREAEEYDSEGKSIRISAVPQASSKQYDRDLENLLTGEEKKEGAQVAASQTTSTTKNNELFEFESEESPPQVSNDDSQYSQSYSDEEQYEGGKKWIEMQFHADPRVYGDIEYDRGPLEDIKEEEITDFEAGSSRFGSLGSHKESIGSVGSMRGSFGSTPDYDVLAGKKYFTRPSDHDNVSLSSLQEFERLESVVAAENSRKAQCGSHDSVNNGSLPRRYVTSRSGHGDDISLSSLKDFEGLEKACREAHLIEMRAREEEDLLEHESPENKYKLESLPRTRVDTTSTSAGSFNASTSGSDDYEKRIKEIDEIIRIAQSNVEKFDRQDDTTEDISQIEITDVAERGAAASQTTCGVQLPVAKLDEPLPSNRESNLMETSTDSLELEDNIDKKHHPLCRSSDSLEMKTTLDFPSLSSDSLNNVRDAKEMQSDVAEHAASVRRISSDSLDMPLLEQQHDADGGERRSNEDDRSDGVTSDNSLERRSETEETGTSDKMRTTPSTNT